MTDLFNTSILRGRQRVNFGSASATYVPQVLTGIVVPLPVIGQDGDVYYKVDADGVVVAAYQKEAGVWVEIGDVNPQWTSFTPTVISGIGTITSYTSISMRYRLIGNICFVFLSVAINVAGTGAGSLKVQIPVEPIAMLGACSSVFASVAAGGVVTGGGFVVPTGASSLGYPSVWLTKYDGTTLIGSGFQIIASVTYETI